MPGLEERVTALEGRVSALEQADSSLRTALANLSSFEPGDWFGFDIQDGSHDEDSRQHKEAPQGAFLTAIETYIEDGHIKMVFGYKKLPKISF